MSFKKRYTENLKIMFQDIDRNSGLVVVLMFLTAGMAVFAITVYLPEGKTGKPLLSPQGSFELIMVFIFSVAASVVLVLFVVAMVSFFETERWAARISWFAASLGMSSSPREFRQASRMLRTLNKGHVSLSTAISQYKQMHALLKTVGQLATEPPRTLAKVRTDRLVRNVAVAEKAAREYMRSDELYSQARLVALLGSSATAANCQPDAEERCYISLAGAVQNPTAVVLLARFQIAGPDPFGVSKSLWLEDIASNDYNFSALLLAPRWVRNSFAGDDSWRDPHVTEPTPAYGTYTDTVVGLWSSDRWSKYHQPERLVNAARRLDSHRKGGDEFKVSS